MTDLPARDGDGRGPFDRAQGKQTPASTTGYKPRIFDTQPALIRTSGKTH